METPVFSSSKASAVEIASKARRDKTVEYLLSK
jgi:hypothetical protein